MDHKYLFSLVQITCSQCRVFMPGFPRVFIIGWCCLNSSILSNSCEVSEKTKNVFTFLRPEKRMVWDLQQWQDSWRQGHHSVLSPTCVYCGNRHLSRFLSPLVQKNQLGETSTFHVFLQSPCHLYIASCRVLKLQ